MYAEPVNYYDAADRSWKEIDNTLTQEKGRYKNKGHGGFSVSFRGSDLSGALVEVSNGEFALSWDVSVQDEFGTKNTLKQFVNASVKQNTGTEKGNFSVAKASSGIRYDAPFRGDKMIVVDYTVSQHKVKEDITVYSKSDVAAVHYTYNCPSLTAVLTENNSLLFVDSEKEAVFTVHTPYMYDSAGNGSYEFDISLQQRGDKCVVVMVPDNEWLSSPERVYPVVIDPTVTTNSYEHSGFDTYVHEGDTAGSHAGTHHTEYTMTVGLKNDQVHRVYLSAGLPTLPANAEIIIATLSLRLTDATSTAEPMSIYRVWGPWYPQQLKYNNQPNISSAPINANVEADIISTTKTISFNVTSYISEYYAGMSGYYGYMIRYTDETANDYNVFYTFDNETLAIHPCLTVGYVGGTESENNNTPENADSVPLPLTSYGAISGKASAYGDFDYYKIVAPRHGKVIVRFSTAYSSSPHTISVYKGSVSIGTRIATTVSQANSSGNRTEAEICFTATRGAVNYGGLDEYYIMVTPESVPVSAYDYTITVEYSSEYASLNWRYPLPAEHNYAISPVYMRGVGDYHEGLDLPAPGATTNAEGEIIGVPIYAPTDAVVVLWGDNHIYYGNYVVLYTTNDKDVHNNNAPFVITFMHMYDVTLVKSGTISKGTLLGYVGATGDVEDAHLHMEVYSSASRPTSPKAPSPEAVITPYDFYRNSVYFTGDPY